MTWEIFRLWFPIVATIINVCLFPVLIVVFNAKVDARISLHNSDIYSHPALNRLEKLEREVEGLTDAITNLKVAVERATFRAIDRRERETTE